MPFEVVHRLIESDVDDDDLDASDVLFTAKRHAGRGLDIGDDLRSFGFEEAGKSSKTGAEKFRKIVDLSAPIQASVDGERVDYTAVLITVYSYLNPNSSAYTLRGVNANKHGTASVHVQLTRKKPDGTNVYSSQTHFTKGVTSTNRLYAMQEWPNNELPEGLIGEVVNQTLHLLALIEKRIVGRSDIGTMSRFNAIVRAMGGWRKS